MADERLLERIHNLESAPDSRMERSVNRQIDSIIKHLSRLLNSRQGSVPIADDYGIPDITNSHGEGVAEMARRIERTIQGIILKYEPRLNDVHVTFQDERRDVLALSFRLEGVLITDKNVPVVLETIVSSDGKINVNN